MNFCITIRPGNRNCGSCAVLWSAKLDESQTASCELVPKRLSRLQVLRLHSLTFVAVYSKARGNRQYHARKCVGLPRLSRGCPLHDEENCPVWVRAAPKLLSPEPWSTPNC